MHIVEQVSDETFRNRGGVLAFGSCVLWESSGVLLRFLPGLGNQSPGLLDFELADDLRLSFVENLKILFVKISDCVPLSIADNGPHQHKLYVHFEGSGFVVSGEFCPVLLSLRLRGGSILRRLRRRLLLRKCGNFRNEKPNRSKQKQATPVPCKSHASGWISGCEEPHGLSKTGHKIPTSARKVEGLRWIPPGTGMLPKSLHPLGRPEHRMPAPFPRAWHSVSYHFCMCAAAAIPTVLSFEDARRVVEEQAALVLASRAAGATERVDLLDAAGRVLAEPVAADRDIPPFPRSTRDGYAVRSGDLSQLPATLEIIGEIKAGESLDRIPARIDSGQTASIMTGAPVPGGADAVVMVEYTTLHENQVEIAKGVAAGENIVPRGAEAKEGAPLLGRGLRLNEAAIALAASVGRSQLHVYNRPR